MWEIISVIVAIIVAFGALFGYLGNKVFKIGEFSHRVDNCEKVLQELQSQVQTINNDIVSIKTALTIKYKGFSDVFTKRNSPRALNSLGMKLYEMMNGDKFLDDNRRVLFERIDKMHPKTALDVESVSQSICITSINDDFFIPIKQFVYSCPTQHLENGEELDVSIDAACYILSFPLRDKYLNAHPEIVV